MRKTTALILLVVMTVYFCAVAFNLDFRIVRSVYVADRFTR